MKETQRQRARAVVHTTQQAAPASDGYFSKLDFARYQYLLTRSDGPDRAQLRAVFITSRQQAEQVADSAHAKALELLRYTRSDAAQCCYG